MTSGTFPIFGAPRPIGSLLVKPASALCNLDCAYCFYLDRDTDPYAGLPQRTMTPATEERLVASWLEYSYPNSTFAFQGGEPTLAGLAFYERLVELQLQHGSDGQNVSNALQTNGILLDDDWCKLLRAYKWLVGISLDGPEPVHDLYRRNRGGAGTWRRVMQSVELLQKHKVDCNVLCVVSAANVSRARELYRFYRSIGVDNLQFIPLAEFQPDGTPHPFTITPEQYGRFLCDLFDLWWPQRRQMRIRFFDNLAESLAGQTPGACTLQDSCDSYVVVEYNGDVFPCDFFVEPRWRVGNVHEHSWREIARNRTRVEFSRTKAIPHAECSECIYETLCCRGCPHTRHAPRASFDDLDYFCLSYKMIYAKAVAPLEREVVHLMRG